MQTYAVAKAGVMTQHCTISALHYIAACCIHDNIKQQTNSPERNAYSKHDMHSCRDMLQRLFPPCTSPQGFHPPPPSAQHRHQARPHVQRCPIPPQENPNPQLARRTWVNLPGTSTFPARRNQNLHRSSLSDHSPGLADPLQVPLQRCARRIPQHKFVRQWRRR